MNRQLEGYFVQVQPVEVQSADKWAELVISISYAGPPLHSSHYKSQLVTTVSRKSPAGCSRVRPLMRKRFYAAPTPAV